MKTLEKNQLALKSGDIIQNPNVLYIESELFKNIYKLLDELDKSLKKIEQDLIEEGLIEPEGEQNG